MSTNDNDHHAGLAAVDDDTTGVHAPQLSHDEPETRVNICGYNGHGVRIAVIVPHDDGYTIPGRYGSGGDAAYGGGLQLQKFSTLETAQAYVRMMNPCTAIRWESEDVPQFDQVRR